MRIYVIRHGQSEANLLEAHAGWAQVSLTPEGMAQAAAVGQRLKEVRFDKVIVSDLLRAQQTAVLALPGYEYQTDWRIREISVGSLMGRRVADCAAQLGEPYLRHRSARDFTAYGGENPEQMQRRVSEFLEDLTKEPPEARIAVVCHEGAMYSMLCHVLKCKLPYLAAYADNGGICVFSYRSGRWVLNKWNETGRLEPDA